MGVTYAEEYGTPVEEWSEGGALTARRTLRCVWTDRHALLVEIAQDGGQDYPHVPNMGCRARGAVIVGVGKNNEFAVAMNEYEDALLKIVYSTEAPQGVGQHRFVTEELIPATDNRRIEIGRLKWEEADGNRLTPAEAPMYLHGTNVYVLTFHDLVEIPVASLRNNVSNDAPVPMFLYPIVFPTETLLHLAAHTSRTVGLGMLGHYRLQYRWIYNDQTWAKHQRSDGEWHYIYHTQTGALVKHYPPVDFSQMYPV